MIIFRTVSWDIPFYWWWPFLDNGRTQAHIIHPSKLIAVHFCNVRESTRKLLNPRALWTRCIRASENRKGYIFGAGNSISQLIDQGKESLCSVNRVKRLDTFIRVERLTIEEQQTDYLHKGRSGCIFSGLDPVIAICLQGCFMWLMHGLLWFGPETVV